MLNHFFSSTLIIFSDECLNNALFQFKNFSVSGLFGLLDDWLSWDLLLSLIFSISSLLVAITIGDSNDDGSNLGPIFCGLDH